MKLLWHEYHPAGPRCEEPHANRLSQLVHAPTAWGEMLKQPHSGLNNNNNGPFFNFLILVDLLWAEQPSLANVSWTFPNKSFPRRTSDPPSTRKEEERTQISGGGVGILCEHNHAHCFGLPASFYFRASFSSTHTCSLSGSSLPSAFYAIMLLGNCRRMMRSVGCVSGASRVMWCVFTSAVRNTAQCVKQPDDTHTLSHTLTHSP